MGMKVLGLTRDVDNSRDISSSNEMVQTFISGIGLVHMFIILLLIKQICIMLLQKIILKRKKL